jgi:hypothetical protein
MDTLLSTAILTLLKTNSPVEPQTAIAITQLLFPGVSVTDSICWSKVENTLDALIRTKEIACSGVSWADRKYSIP